MDSLKCLILIFWVSCLLVSCKIEEFTGFKVETISRNESFQLTGQVLNYFTNDSVPGALVKIGNRQTITDIRGSFILQYVLNESEKRNKPTPVEISAPNFYVHRENLLLNSKHSQFIFYLKYAAPIVLDMTIVYRQNFDYNFICQAIIKDFQGTFTIQSVKAVFFTRDAPDDSLISFLSLKNFIDPQTGQFQSTFLLTDWFPEWYYIEVIDNEGYRDRITRPISGNEEFLFNP